MGDTSVNYPHVNEGDFSPHQLNETMGYDSSNPKEFIDKVYSQYLKTAFAHRTPKWEASFTLKTPEGEDLTFVVESGKNEDYYDAARFSDGTIHLNNDRLSMKSEESAKSSIAHELVHIGQHGKVDRGERGEGEYGYNTAVNVGKINTERDLDEDRGKYLWMMDVLQENEIEAKLSQVYYYVKENLKYTELKGNATDFVNLLVDNMNDITKLDDIKEAIDSTKHLFDIKYAWYIHKFVKDAENALYGRTSGKNRDLEGEIKVGLKLLTVYQKRYYHYRQKVYNTVWQAIQDYLEEQ